LGAAFTLFLRRFQATKFQHDLQQVIVDAISELKDRTGSSMIAIKKLMMSKFPADKKW
jgi:histone H1/5